jgi:arginine/lysine/ornithine decarboxylase
MPKVSIYVPDDMKARMDAAGERANWSAIAQRAFDVELFHIDAIKEIKTMTDVIDRLRASKEKFIQGELADGKKCGIDWAKKHAEYDELRVLTALTDVGLPVAQGDPENGYDLAYWLAQKVFEDERPGDDEIAALLQIDEEAVQGVSREFVESFIAGATDVWDEIKNAI